MNTIDVRNPFTGQLVFSEASESRDALDKKIAAAREAFLQWRKLPPHVRADRVSGALNYFRDHREEIATQVTNEMGKPITEARSEVDFMIERAEYMCRFAREGALKPFELSAYSTADFEGRIEFVPKGVAYIISPWNYPLFCAINGVVCALLSGSTVLLKHTTTPSAGRHFQRAFGSLGGIESLLADVVIDYDTSAAIIEHGDIDHVIFTGSVAGGRAVQRSVALRANHPVRNPFIHASLELGGSDAAYVAEDADLEQAVEWTVRIGRLHNSGQSCCAVKRVFVHERLYERYLDGAASVMRAQRSGDPMHAQTDLGPLYGGSEAVISLQRMISDAVAQGARVVEGGDVVTIGSALFLRPTLLTDVRPEMAVLQEETFGPVLPVMKVSSDALATEQVNASRFALTASIFTRSNTRATQFIDSMESGTVYVNRCNFVDARLGWIGHKSSGNGSLALSPLGLQMSSAMRSVNIDPGLLR